MLDIWSVPSLSLTNEPTFCLMFYHFKAPLHQDFRLISVSTEPFEFLQQHHTHSLLLLSLSLRLCQFLSPPPFFLSGYGFT